MKYTKIFLFLFLIAAQFAFSQETAEIVIENAQRQAKAENKNVMVFFHASWCGWCKKMEKKMNSEFTKAIFDKNYVLASLDVQERGEKVNLENPGGEEWMNKLGGENAGLPYFVFLDSEGKILENSLNSEKENLGCPSTPEEIKLFVDKLQKTSKLSKEELNIVSRVFSEK